MRVIVIETAIVSVRVIVSLSWDWIGIWDLHVQNRTPSCWYESIRTKHHEKAGSFLDMSMNSEMKLQISFCLFCGARKKAMITSATKVHVSATTTATTTSEQCSEISQKATTPPLTFVSSQVYLAKAQRVDE